MICSAFCFISHLIRALKCNFFSPSSILLSEITRDTQNIFFQWSNVVFSPTAVTFSADLELELGELLQEFQDVVEELKAPSQSKSHAYQHVLQEAKSRTGLGDDSGVEDSDYGE